MDNLHDTIFALATHPGKAGVAIIRISGAHASHILSKICHVDNIKPRFAQYTPIINPETGELIDNAIIIFFAAPNSFTGEDVIELHIHGSVAIINSLLNILAKIDNFRLAMPGEFARRSFYNGKMDLTQAEGLADLVAAETEMQHKQALRQSSGELKMLYEKWRQQIIQLLGYVEAYIDFPDEELPSNLVIKVDHSTTQLKNAINNHLNDNRCGEKIRSGLYITILGQPNVGKSSLINFLAKRDVAIISNIAGTTRDILEVHLNIAGYAVTIADTAGIRTSTDIIEIEGIKKAKERARHADFNIIMFDATNQDNISKTQALIDHNAICVINKIDNCINQSYLQNINNPVLLSIRTGEGMDDFLQVLTDKIHSMLSYSVDPIITRSRYRNHLCACIKYLETFNLNKPIELAAEDLRLAAREIAKITGDIDVDTILDEIFHNFCIGK